MYQYTCVHRIVIVFIVLLQLPQVEKTETKPPRTRDRLHIPPYWINVDC